MNSEDCMGFQIPFVFLFSFYPFLEKGLAFITDKLNFY